MIHMYALFALIVLSLIVTIHELGHFFVARLCGVGVIEFSIGMGPAIYKYKKEGSETTLSIRTLPLGGFVEMAGEEGTDIEDSDKVFKKGMFTDSMIEDLKAEGFDSEDIQNAKQTVQRKSGTTDPEEETPKIPNDTDRIFFVSFIFDKYFNSICLMSRISTSIIIFMVFSRFSFTFFFPFVAMERVSILYSRA